ncbi:MAG: Hsp20/alpha crystallin family protein [Opitutaceae bacterium]
MSLLENLLPSLSRSSQPATNAADHHDGVGYSVKPVHEIAETAEAFGVTVFLPGVTKDGLELTAEEGTVRIVGRVAWKQPEGWTALYRESADAPYGLVLTHDNAIDADKIAAELRDGVLRISLPKHEALKPRKIAIG